MTSTKVFHSQDLHISDVQEIISIKSPIFISGCQRTFASTETLITHMEKVHKEKVNIDSMATIIPESIAPTLIENAVEETYTVRLNFICIQCSR